jgi:hypothetical protein
MIIREKMDFILRQMTCPQIPIRCKVKKCYVADQRKHKGGQKHRAKEIINKLREAEVLQVK